MSRLRVAIIVVMSCMALAMALPLAVSWGETATILQELVPAERSALNASDTLAVLASTPLTGTTWVTVTLPLILRNWSQPVPCPNDSPFGIQIAALHQVQPPSGQAQPVSALQEAEWLARFEAGFPTLVDALKASGTCWTRLQVDWAMIQPDPPPAPYVWGPYHDDLLRLVAESKVQMIATIHDVPGWARDNGEQRIAPDRMDEFAQFLTDLINRYKQPPYNIHHWELFNEPDGIPSLPGIGGWGNQGGQYEQMLRRAYGAIKAADPGATVLMGGVAYDNFTEYNGPFNRYFVDDVMAAGGGNYVDVTNLHYFPDFFAEWERWVQNGNWPTCGYVEDQQGKTYEAWGIDLVAKAKHFRNRLLTCFVVDKPVWVTELAEHGNHDKPEVLAQQARYVVQGQIRALAAGVERVVWFALVSPPYDPFEQGLLYETDWSPKPAFYSYQTLIKEMAGYSYAYSLDASGVEGYVFRNAAQQEKTVAWAWGEAGQLAYLTFASASRLRVVDRQGQVIYVQDGGPGDVDGVHNGSVRLQLPAPPTDNKPYDPPRFTAEPLFITRSN